MPDIHHDVEQLKADVLRLKAQMRQQEGVAFTVAGPGGTGTILPSALPAHDGTHENGGTDEISVAGLSGVLADQQTPINHDHSGDAGDGGTFDGTNLTSGAATDGFVLTADGAGGAAWETAGAATDADAIHDNVAAEISAITEKATPVAGDWLLIEDSAAGNAKKKIQVGNLPAGPYVFYIPFGSEANEGHAYTA